jgi:3',5'-cyclic AMP phosphodiesterase CpdA
VGVLTILHASDLQCGRPYRPDVAEAFVRLAHAVAPDVVVVAGDLTQRAKKSEYATAVALLARLPPVPIVVTPGNHDVPLWRVWERAVSPYRNWQRAFGGDLDTVTRVPGATFVALNSSAPWRALVAGRLHGHQLALAHRVFESSPEADVRVLVVHHHFLAAPDGDGGRPVPNAREHVRALEAMRADLVLGGHVHQTQVRSSSELTGTAVGVPLVACGTTTSRRGRGSEIGRNSLNVIRVDSTEIEVHPHVHESAARAFEPAEPIVLRRARAPEPGASSVGSNP